ncbi:unnamed protein product [Orchesella dallaii]|uniref:C2H2-type domain-containing protein n=1 Tax=Orchesella dallaii TaxID=48710 RepID=A0ABP1R9J1_9HEXA
MLVMEVNDHLVMACEDWISDGPVDSFSLSNDGFDENGSPLNFSHEEDDNDVTNEEGEVPQKLKEEPVEPPKMSPLKDFSKTQSVPDQNKNGSDSDLDELQEPDSRSRRKRSREAAAKKKDQDDLDDSTFEPDSSAEESSDQISSASASDSDWSLPPPEKKPKKLILTVAKRGRGRPRKYPLNPSKPKPKPKAKQVKVQTDDDDDDGEIEGDKEELECPQCDKKLTNNHRLQSHIRFVHNPITCNLCQKDFIGQHSLRDHAAKEHQGEGNFSCPTCCRPFPSYYSMSRHMRRIHHDRRYTCPQCGVTVKTSRSLRLHTNAVHNPTPITCQHCGKVSACLKYHREHIIQKHPETKVVSNANALEKKYPCPICTKASFNRKTHLDRHLLSCGIKKVRSRKNKAESSEFQSYLCNFCGKEFTGKKKTYYRAHLLTHANLDDKEPTFQCHKCPTAFHFRHQLTQHVRRVHNMPKKGRRDLPPKMHLKCMFPSCGMRFPKGNGRKEHIAQSHADIKEGGGAAGFLCEDCGRLFRPEYKQRYEIHVEAHFGAKPFQCPHCPSTFSYTRNFDEHMKDYHSEGGKEKESKIDCTQEGCDKKFKVQSKLKKHLREDHGIRRPIGVRAMRRLLKAECGGNVPPKKDKEGAGKGEKPKQMYLCHTCGKGFSGREYYKAHLLKHNEDDKPSIQCDQCPSTFHAMIQLKQHIRRNHKGLKKGRKILPKEVMLQCLFPPVEGEGGVQQKEEHVEENQGDKTESFQPNFSEIL